MSSLYLRGPRVWIYYYDRWGLRHRKPLGVELVKVERRNGRVIWPRDVLDLKHRFDIQLAAGKFDLGPTQESNVKLSELITRFIDEHGHTRASTTQELYRRAVDSLIENIGDAPVPAVEEQRLLTWRRRLFAAGRSAHTVSKHIRSLSAIFTWAVDRGILIKNPITQYVRVTPTPLPIIPLSDSEISAVMNAARAPERDLFTFMLLSGFRVGEACALKWSDVDTGQKLIRGWNAKEKRWDYFPMDKELAALMRRLPRSYGEHVFVYRTPGSASRAFRRIRDKLKINDQITLHTLRTNFISRLINSGATESAVMHLARHRSIVTTHKYYTAFDQDSMRQALEQSRKPTKRKRPGSKIPGRFAVTI
jgi:integrase